MSVNKFKLPILSILAVLMILGMLRLAVWQLDRAEFKRGLKQSMDAKLALPEISLEQLLADSATSLSEQRYRSVNVQGNYLQSGSIYIDNEVLNGQVGYKVITPFRLLNSQAIVLVDRGWVAVGPSRAQLPQVETSDSLLALSGRLNLPKARPPIWKDEYPVFDNSLWQYLPIDAYQKWSGYNVLPLIFEPEPDSAEADLTIVWREFDDFGIATHKGYAFQWFAMALGFFICCIVVLLRSIRNKP
jgi:surfeit locus 1 family protein